jgi:hypothetical protein
MSANMTKIIIFSFRKGCLIKTLMFCILAYEKILLGKIKGKKQLGKS